MSIYKIGSLTVHIFGVGVNSVFVNQEKHVVPASIVCFIVEKNTSFMFMTFGDQVSYREICSLSWLFLFLANGTFTSFKKRNILSIRACYRKPLFLKCAKRT
jgi:hypothetical protein